MHSGVCELRRTRDKGQKLKQERFRLDLRRNFFSKRTAQLQSRLPREAVPSISLGVLKAQLDKALSNLA